MNLVLLAIVPTICICIFIYFKDKYEKEPKRLLITSFLLGATISVLLTSIIYSITDLFIVLDGSSPFQLFVRAFFIVALTEEFSKYIIIRYFAQPKLAFNEAFDGIVYAVMVSMGFAATENIFYVINGGIETAVLRAFTAVPAHAVFAILMGYFMGKAKFSKTPKKNNLIGLILALIFHGAYDYFLFLEYIPGIWVGAFISLFLGIVLSRSAIILHQRRSQFKNES